MATGDARASVQPVQAKAGASFDASGETRASLQPVRARATGYAHGSAYAAAASVIEGRDAVLDRIQPLPTGDSTGSDADEDALAAIRRRYVSKRERAVLALEPKFQALSDPILHLVVAGVERVGPHVGNPDFPTDMLQAFARYEQEKREYKRSRRWNLGLAILAGIIAILSPIATLIVQALFFPS